MRNLEKTIHSERIAIARKTRTPFDDRRLFWRRVLLAVVFVIVYVALDRSSVSFQIWPGISAWYPPVGLALAMMIAFGPECAPLVTLSGAIAAAVNYDSGFFTYTFQVGNFLTTFGYTAAAYLLRRYVRLDWRLQSMRDVSWLLFLSIISSGVVGSLGATMLVVDHSATWATYADAALNWWAGDAVALSSLAPFCLVFLAPSLRRFAGVYETQEEKERERQTSRAQKRRSSRARVWEIPLFIVCIFSVLWFVRS